MKNSALFIGFITGIAMIALAITFDQAGLSPDAWYQYLIYLIYFIGIAWAMLRYSKSTNEQISFGSLFSRGFRVFIIVTLLMVILTAVLSKLNPEYANESGEAYRAFLQKEGNRSPNEINELVQKYKNQFTIRLVSQAIFGYLASGAIFSVIISGILIARKK